MQLVHIYASSWQWSRSQLSRVTSAGPISPIFCFGGKGCWCSQFGDRYAGCTAAGLSLQRTKVCNNCASIPGSIFPSYRTSTVTELQEKCKQNMQEIDMFALAARWVLMHTSKPSEKLSQRGCTQIHVAWVRKPGKRRNPYIKQYRSFAYVLDIMTLLLIQVLVT